MFAALAVGRLIEERTGWSIRRFVRTARRYRTVQIRAGQQLITAADPIPIDLHEALADINRAAGAHQIEPTRDRNLDAASTCFADDAVWVLPGTSSGL